MRDRSAIFVFAIVVVGITVLLLAWDGLFVPASADSPCENNMCRAYRVFSEFQTLAGAGIAIFAAWLAAQPVWKQLTKMNVQQDIMAREIIERRLKSIEANDRYMDTKLAAYLQDVWKQIYDWHAEPAEYDPQSIDPHWAFDMEKHASEILSELGRQQMSKGDTVNIEDARAEVVKALGELASCLDSISAPARLAGDPDISDEQEKELLIGEQAARIAFEGIANSVDAARKAFGLITASEINRIRKRIREIDDHLLRAHDD